MAERSPGPAPRFNHVAMSVAPALVGRAGREALLRFYGEVFGWTEMPSLGEEGRLLVMRAYRNDQFVFLAASEEPMRCRNQEHFGMSVASAEHLDRMYATAARWREADLEVELSERQTRDFRVLTLHSFYVRYRIPLWTEVQCFEWAPGVDTSSLPGGAG